MGSALCRVLEARSITPIRPHIPWNAPALAAHAAVRAAMPALEAGGEVFWCAGQGIPASPPDAFATERACLNALVEAGAASHHRPRIFLASSAGAVYAGRTDPPFSDHTHPDPITPYGYSRIEFEHLLSSAHQVGAISAWSGRVSNLYGPGGNPGKPQGLLTHLIDSALTGRSMNIYVPLSTRRDYLYVDDCAQMIFEGMQFPDNDQPMPRVILSSGTTSSIREVIELAEATLGKPIPFTTEHSNLADVQPDNLAMTPSSWMNLHEVQRTPLEEGIKRLVERRTT